MGNYRQKNISEEDFISIFTRIHKVLNELQIEYWLSFGTLLGYIREGKQIEGDSDLDFGCTSNAMDVLEKNIDLIYKQGFKIVKNKFRDRGKWRGIFIYDENIKNFHIDISEWKYDDYHGRFTFRWYLRLNLPSKIFDVLYKIIEKQMRKLNDSSGVQTTNFTRYRKTSILSTISNICFEIDWFFNTKRELQVWIPALKKVKYYDTKTFIPCYPELYTETNYGASWRTPNNKFRGKGGSECIKTKVDGWERCWVDD